MHGKWHILLFLAALGCGGLAGYCQQRSRGLTEQADLAQARSASSSASFVDTFSGEFVDSQLGQLDQRRALIRDASRWQEVSLFALLGVVLFAFAGYTARSVEAALEDGEHAALGHAQPLPAGQQP